MQEKKNIVQEFFVKSGAAISNFFKMLKACFMRAGNCILHSFRKFGKNIYHVFLALQKWFVTKRNRQTEKKHFDSKQKEQKTEQTHTSQNGGTEQTERMGDASKDEQNSTKDPGDAVKKSGLTNPTAKKSPLTAKEFFFNFFDILASLVFILCLFIITKPILLCGFFISDDIKAAMTFLDKIGFLLFSSGNELAETELIEFIGQSASRDIMYIRNCIAAASLFLFVLIKLIASLFSFGTKKLISFLLSLLSIGTLLVVFDNFLAFLLLSYLAYFIFQLSCGATAKAILTKTILIVLLSLVAYPVLNFFLTPGVCDMTNHLIELLKPSVPFF